MALVGREKGGESEKKKEKINDTPKQLNMKYLDDSNVYGVCAQHCAIALRVI